MREAPSVHVRATRFGVWRAALLSTLFGCLGGLWLWWLSRSQAATAWPMAVAIASSIATIGVVARLWIDNRAFDLRWDGERWSVCVDRFEGTAHRSPAKASRHADRPVFMQGELTVAVDLGSWLLLRFDRPLFEPNLSADTACTDVNSILQRIAVRPATQRLWLPLQRTGLQRQWHALRCALYSRASPDFDKSRVLISQDPA